MSAKLTQTFWRRKKSVRIPPPPSPLSEFFRSGAASWHAMIKHPPPPPLKKFLRTPIFSRFGEKIIVNVSIFYTSISWYLREIDVTITTFQCIFVIRLTQFSSNMFRQEGFLAISDLDIMVFWGNNMKITTFQCIFVIRIICQMLVKQMCLNIIRQENAIVT